MASTDGASVPKQASPRPHATNGISETGDVGSTIHSAHARQADPQELPDSSLRLLRHPPTRRHPHPRPRVPSKPRRDEPARQSHSGLPRLQPIQGQHDAWAVARFRQGDRRDARERRVLVPPKVQALSRHLDLFEHQDQSAPPQRRPIVALMTQCYSSAMSTSLGRWERVILEFAAARTTSQTRAEIKRRLGRWVQHCRSENIDPTRRDEETAFQWVSELNLLTKPGTPMAPSTQSKYKQLLRAWFAWWEGP